MRAATSTRSPTTRFTGKRPQSICGSTSRIWMRGGGVFVFGSGTSQEVSRMREDQDVDLGRSSGILLHPTSLPGGRLGDDAYRFVDWLAQAGQSWWQMLPLGPPDKYGSPYKAASAFAASPALLEKPRARVTKAEEDAFRERHSYWIGGWEKFAG